MDTIINNKKKIFFKRPAFGIIILLLGIGILMANRFLPKYFNGDIKSTEFVEPSYVAESRDGRYAIADNYENIYVIDKEGNLDFYLFSSKDVDYDQVAFDDEGNLYILESIYIDGINTEQKICEYDMSGKFVREVYYCTDPDNIYVSAFQIVNNKLCYLVEDDEGIHVVSSDTDSKEIVKYDVEVPSDEVYILFATPDYEGNYVVTNADRSCGIVYANGEYEEYLTCEYDFYDNPDADVVMWATKYKSGIAAVLNEKYMNYVYMLNASGANPTKLIDVFDIVTNDFINEVGNNFVYVSFLWTTNDGVALLVHNDIYFVDGDNNVSSICGIKGIPFGINIMNFIHKVGRPIGWILVGIGALLCLLNLMRWHLSLLWKQLLVTVPVVIIMFDVLTVSFIKSYDEQNMDNMAEKLLALNEVAVDELDGDELQEMTDFSIVFDGRLDELEGKLSAMLYSGMNDWAENISTSVYLIEDGLYGLRVGTSSYLGLPFCSSMDLGYSMDEHYIAAADKDDDSIFMARNDSVVLLTGGYNTDNISAMTLIRNSNDEEIGMMITNLDYASFQEKRQELILSMVYKATAFLVVLIAIIVLMTYLNTRRLKMAGNAITEIAAGNFSARVKRVGKDEVGAICGGVNEMAEKLELHFEELDKNEKFYYKFVPEKFKELLHKDTFTDLRLGDAESADLTVLFCDIRSFSLNSEMMTAKENFEFVNVIYGKAGPIIRKHNGFVDKYIGDAVMALFENADDAVEAGKELYKEIVLNESTASELGVRNINIGIGIHSGMARVGIVGEKERLSGTVISNTVNISSRLESLTKQYSTAMIITKETFDRLHDPDSLSTRYLGMIQVAGVNEVKALYEVLDCLDEERKAPREKTAHEFREAIKSFHMGKYSEALELLEGIECDNGCDPVPSMYKEYMREKISAGDKEHNVFKFEKK